MATLSMATTALLQLFVSPGLALINLEHPPLPANRSCPLAPPLAKHDASAPRMFFIGAHHAGTTFHSMLARRELGFSRSLHDPHWTHEPDLWWAHDAFADSPYFGVEADFDVYEYGHWRHPDVRFLARCFARAILVLNTRALDAWLVSKIAHEHFVPVYNKAQDATADFDACAHVRRSVFDVQEHVCAAALSRERFHARALDTIGELNASARFAVTDATAVGGAADTSARLCTLRERFLSDYAPTAACEAAVARSGEGGSIRETMAAARDSPSSRHESTQLASLDIRQCALDAIRGVLTSEPDARRDSRGVVRGACALVPKLTTTDARILAFPASLVPRRLALLRERGAAGALPAGAEAEMTRASA